jgi:hypothetical protein
MFSLCEQTLNDLALDVGLAEVAACVTVGELEVIEAEEVQDRRVRLRCRKKPEVSPTRGF